MTASAPPAAAPAPARVEEHVTLPAPRARVWRALTTPEEFGAWFGVNLAGAAFVPGQHASGRLTIPNYDHLVLDLLIEEMVPEERFSWRWHPHAVERDVDYSDEPRTLVTFTLEDAPEGGTLLRVVETGFEALPEGRRGIALLGVGRGWPGQLGKRLPAYLAANA